ncbi:uncharacterized protein C3orf38 homolog [Tachyglossus aculeatus]|uniref:uncharacterized protein C3orf38 homolog n=1 Tax=Tachyglossus aculeatus TaxID=9261 RepID=UPI0018F44892|nr:uncharacterized protein C3orf38 homolog [Tachyglossus aculeatus]
MSGLNEQEVAGCRSLLALLDTEEILSLCDTITGRLVQPESRQDAIHAILSYSQNVEELLKRKKVYREIIFKYLAMEGIIVPPSSEKHHLIQRAKNHWNKRLELKSEPEDASKPENTSPPNQNKDDQKADKKFDECRKLGEEFCRWFFELLNSQNPFLGSPREAWGPQHFWDDVKLQFCYNTSEHNVLEYYGAEMVSLRLLSLVKEEFLFLNPNLDFDGLKCASSPHGLVVVAVAGTVHRGDNCLGIFEQVFGLIRSGYVENTWKIKFVNLRIVGQSALEPGTVLQKPSIRCESLELEAMCNRNELRWSSSGPPNDENETLCSENAAALLPKP